MRRLQSLLQTQSPCLIITRDGKVVDSANQQAFGLSDKESVGNLQSYLDPSDFEDLVNQVLQRGQVEHYSTQSVRTGRIQVKNLCKVVQVDGEPLIWMTAKEIDFLAVNDKACPNAAKPEQFHCKRDYEIWKVLCKFDHLRVEPVDLGDHIQIRCQEKPTAYKISLEFKPFLGKYCESLTIFLMEDVFLSCSYRNICEDSFVDSKVKNMSTVANANGLNLSRWVKDNKLVFDSIPNATCIVHSLRKEDDYKFLAVRPDITEKRLNKPVAELINNGLSIIDPVLGDLRRFYLERLLKSGGKVSFDYKYDWDRLPWEFDVNCCHLPGYDEALVIVSDREPHQRQYWFDRP